MLIEAAVAIGSGSAACRLPLIAFGADSPIELTSASLLLWRLDVEMRQGAEFPRASSIGRAGSAACCSSPWPFMSQSARSMDSGHERARIEKSNNGYPHVTVPIISLKLSAAGKKEATIEQPLVCHARM